ncbi:sialate O-acetylesterase [Ohtaekwangia sp.]|uniref:sialate O-acetylesterase n=1 Tax=Ohtaekwangia sp. TaxID=2066019 RepID=UPI002FDD5DA1
MKFLSLNITCLLVVLHYTLSLGQVRLPRLISDGMVIQRDVEVKVWGWAAAREVVTVRFKGKNYTTKTSAEGKWQVTLVPSPAGGPYDLDVEASNHITVKNILVGDVWVCSGQSNMALPMERVKERYPDVIAQASNPFIRHFFLSTQYNFKQPQDDIPSGSWEAATPASVLKFSATAYFFAKTLYEKYHIPVGLLNASVGGSPAEAWLSAEALKTFPEAWKESQRFSNDRVIDSIITAERLRNTRWYNSLRRADEGYKGEIPWFDVNYIPSGWSVMNIPGYWRDYGLAIHGVVWFRKEVNIPASITGKPARLFLGCIVDSDSVYINGIFAGSIGYRYPPRRYELPAGLLKPGKNTIVIRVINSSGKGGFVKDKNYKIVSGKESVDLQGAWQYKVGAIADSLPPTTFIQYKAGGLFNAMIAPLVHYPIKGVIWYQGESNIGIPGQYQALFSSLITDWRKQWKQGNFPFLYVQLANYSLDATAESGWPALREAQRKTLSVPNTGMAVTIDIGEWNDLHPLNKEDVGKRLALLAEKWAYHEKNIVYTGPLYQSMKIKKNKISLTFTNTGSGLTAKGGDALKQFMIAGSDKQFVPAQAIIQGNRVTVWSESVTSPVAVRYAWANDPKGANLYNKEGLPASPFKTDD